jgi:hypothetical protein
MHFVVGMRQLVLGVACALLALLIVKEHKMVPEDKAYASDTLGGSIQEVDVSVHATQEGAKLQELPRTYVSTLVEAIKIKNANKETILTGDVINRIQVFDLDNINCTNDMSVIQEINKKNSLKC